MADALYGLVGFPVGELRHHVGELVSDLAGVVEGFELSIEGPAPGNVIRIHAGTALDQTFQLIHVDDLLSTSAVLALEGPGLHHVGVIFRLVPSDTAPRTFFDPDAENPDGTRGREFIQDVRTRFTPTWQPVVSLNDPSFSSAPGVADPSLVVPLCVVPVTTDALGRSVIDTAALAGKLSPVVGKLRSVRTVSGTPPKSVLRLERAHLFRPGNLIQCPPAPTTYTATVIDPVASEITLDRELGLGDRAIVEQAGVVTSPDGVSLIRGRGRLADPAVPGDTSEPGDVRTALFGGNPRRGARLLASLPDDRLGAGEQYLGRDQDALGTDRNLRDALALIVREMKFGADPAAATWIDPVPVPLWDLARHYLADLSGTGLVDGGIASAVQLPWPGIPFIYRWRIQTTFAATTFYCNGIRHRLRNTTREAAYQTSPVEPTLYVYWWAIARPNPNEPGPPLTGPDWPEAPVELVFTTATSFTLEPTPPPSDPERTVLLGAVRLSALPPGGTPVIPVISILDIGRSPRRTPDRFAFDRQGRIQRDLIFRAVPGVADAGRTLKPDLAADPAGKLNVELGTGRLLGLPGARVELLQSPTDAGRIECKEADVGSATVARLSSGGIDLESADGAGARAVRLWISLADAAPRGEWRMANDPGTSPAPFGTEDVLDAAPTLVPSLIGLARGNAPGALQLRAADRLADGLWRDGTVFTQAEVVEIRRRLRLLGQLSMPGVERDGAGAALSSEQGFNFLNLHKLPLAWVYVAFDGPNATIQAQSHFMNSNGRPAVLERGTAWLQPFQAPVFGPTNPIISGADPTRPAGSVRLLGPPPHEATLRAFQLPWSSYFPLLGHSSHVVTVSATPDWDKWSRHPMEFPVGAIWWGPARDLFYSSDPADRLSAADGPIIAYTWPWVSGVMVQVWNALARPSRGPTETPTSQSDTYLRSV